MALGNKRNLIVGAAAVFIGPTSDTPLDLEDVSRAAWVAPATPTLPSGWRNVGFTQDGLEIATDPSYGEVEVDQLLDAALIFKDGMGLTISTTFAEATLENLLVAWGQPNEIATGTTTTPAGTYSEIDIEGGSLGEAPLERSLVAIGNSPRGTAAGSAYGERVYYAYRVLSTEAATVSVARADASTIPVTFRAMPDDNGKYGVVRDTRWT